MSSEFGVCSLEVPNFTHSPTHFPGLMQNLYTDLTVVFKLVLFDSLKLYLSDVETNLATLFESPRVNSVNFSIIKFERRKQKSNPTKRESINTQLETDRTTSNTDIITKRRKEGKTRKDQTTKRTTTSISIIETQRRG